MAIAAGRFQDAMIVAFLFGNAENLSVGYAYLMRYGWSS